MFVDCTGKLQSYTDQPAQMKILPPCSGCHVDKTGIEQIWKVLKYLLKINWIASGIKD